MLTLMEEAKPEIMEKDEFEYQDKTLSNALLGISELSEFLCKEQNPQLFNHLVGQNPKFSDWDLD